ncbi:protein RNA-directed DNA methylation 3 [Solanum tuberosum]|uniref:Pentatricopeptide repeat-containing protein n=2 Tax=Solanum tuberosum TaxID=4113 RepID=M1A951_SOLTU|nr:PREDICTED: protein RNA-directed DNA methylation 3 [Solanum tuberosum]
MGNWNRRRWIPRKNYKQEDFPPSQPYHYNQSPYHAIQQNSVPLWEIDFCRAAGIPWHKVVSAKTYMYCYENVVKWDDSAGQEAFNDAKRRYWAEIRGLPPQNPPPNPDLYIDKVDWDSAIDPELILDLDREYFNPNEVKNSVKSENNLVPGCTLVWEDKNADNGENHWGSGNVQGSKTAANGENPWESGNVQGSKTAANGENPWESGNVQGSKTAANGENPWESGNVQGSKTAANGENPWESGNVQGSKTAANGENPWESGNVQGSKTAANGENPWESGNVQGSKTAANGENPWESGNVQGSKTAANGENPWESGNVQGSKTAANGENPWESGNVQGSKTAANGENPWESGNVQGSKTAANGENPWESGNVQGSKTAANGENPWESGNVQGSKPGDNRENPWESASIEDTKQTWNEWYTPVNIKDDNPWERSSPKTQGILKDTAWGGCGNESWGWNTGMNYENGYACVDNSFSNLWHQSGACVSGAKGNEWVDNSVGSWGQTYWNTGGHEQRNSDYGSRWNRNLSRGGGTTSKDRRWRGSEVTSWDYQQQPRQSNERNVDFGRPSRGDKTFYTGSRKRESSSQHVPRYKSSRFQSDEQRTATNWREEKTQKRVTFNMYD